MHEEKIKYGYRKKRKKDREYSKKINFYRDIAELPDEISSDEYKNIIKKKPRLNKHEKTVYNGIKYHSGWEAEYAKELDIKKVADEIKDWQRQVKIEINVIEEENKPILTDKPMIELKQSGIKYTHICNYYIDFVITHKDDTKEYVEIKGARMELWKLKFRLFESIFKIIHPEIKITIIS